jgi:DNA-binding GntR family transcriptional regulator
MTDALPILSHGVQTRKKAVSLSNQTYDELKHLIFEFQLLPGEMLFENQLSEVLKVSRTPLRQALQRLEHEGFLVSRPKIGWQVAQLDFEVLDELYDFRILTESHAIEVLCKSEHPRDLLLDLCNVWLVPEVDRLHDPIEVGQLDEEFHATLLKAAGNREMAKTHFEITQRIRIIRRLDFTKASRIHETYREHGMILTAILGSRKSEAIRLLKAHIEQSKIEVRKITLSMLFDAKETKLRA